MSIAIDGHVHIYPDFSISGFFDAAWQNFSKLQDTPGLSGHLDCALFLTEGGEHDVFGILRERAESDGLETTDSLCLQKTEEPDSLIAEKNGQRIFIFTGRQYISRENIELLSLFSTPQIVDRSLRLPDLAQAVAGNGGVVVVPWGVGKWFGERGKVVKSFLESSHDFQIFAGDNGNRPLFWPTPSLLRLARKKQIPVLSGSDPLPLASHCNRAASSGTILSHGELSKTCPAASLRKLLGNVENLREFGSRLGSLRFFYDQVRINLRNRM